MRPASPRHRACRNPPHHRRIFIRPKSLRLIDILLAFPPLSKGRPLFATAQTRKPSVAFAFDLGEGLIKPRIIRRKKEGTTEINSDRLRLGPQPSDDVANVDGEIADEVLSALEI